MMKRSDKTRIEMCFDRLYEGKTSRKTCQEDENIEWLYKKYWSWFKAKRIKFLKLLEKRRDSKILRVKWPGNTNPVGAKNQRFHQKERLVHQLNEMWPQNLSQNLMSQTFIYICWSTWQDSPKVKFWRFLLHSFLEIFPIYVLKDYWLPKKIWKE